MFLSSSLTGLLLALPVVLLAIPFGDDKKDDPKGSGAAGSGAAGSGAAGSGAAGSGAKANEAPQSRAAAEKTTGKVGETCPKFTAKLVDVRSGKSTEFDSAKQDKTTVYAIVGATCPVTPLYVDRVKELEKKYAEKGVSFVHIYPNKTESAAEKSKFHKESGYLGSMIDDVGGKITRLFDAKKTSDFIVCDKAGKVVYRGGIDDNPEDAKGAKKHFLDQALGEHVTGKAVTVKTSMPLG